MRDYKVNNYINLADDIYYQEKYAALYVNDNSELFDFSYQKEDKKVIFRAIKRKITHVASITINEELYDLETPYGYGGPYTNCYDKVFLNNAFLAYKRECIKQKIVCEFIRFHPFNPLSSHKNLLDFHIKDREVVIVDLSLSTKERWAQYSKNTRNILRKANKKLDTVKNSGSLSTFCKLYKQTMKKNNASDFYYFQPEYFKELLKIKSVELLSVESESITVSTGFFMYGKDVAHYHLSANNNDLSLENGNYALLDFAFEQAKGRGCKWAMLGGGRTTDENDSLFKFKSKFSKQSLPFIIGGLTFLPEVRDRLNTIWRRENPHSHLKLFQLYRHS